MPYQIVRSLQARRDIRDFVRYLKAEAGDMIARACLTAPERELEVVLTHRPKAFTWFRETGAPYRGKLFRFGRTTYWIVYTVDDALQRVEIVKFWHSARQPETHGL